MTDEQEKRFHECIKALPPRSGNYETPEILPVLESTDSKELKIIAKELHSISQELNTLNRILKRKSR